MGDQIPETMKGSNIERGIKYLKKAADQLYPKAYLNLGKCYENGLGVKKNDSKAKGMYTQGADMGDTQCKLQLVKCLINSDRDIKDDTKIGQYLR